MFLSVFDVFKIGIGPSSSHTMGPMVAAHRFIQEIEHGTWPRPSGTQVHRIEARLHGSLAFTGKGHASDNAIILGLLGHEPKSLDPDAVEDILAGVLARKTIKPNETEYRFDPTQDLVFDYDEMLPEHTNGMTFTAFDSSNRLVLRQIYYSVGGGFVATPEELQAEQKQHEKPANLKTNDVPFPFTSAAEMLKMAKESGLTIANMKRHNEKASGAGDDFETELLGIWDAMNACIERGLKTGGIMPGGLKVRRRASAIYKTLGDEKLTNTFNPMEANEWLSTFAMAVNEENACGGKVVTAPTNGAAGVIPSVIRYYTQFDLNASRHGIADFLLTAAAIGGIIKHRASISGAEVGCQGEVGSAAAMAAAGLCAAQGGTPEQVENAAEIALEHHLGMTCDPVAGLVQVPCIERNALGAVKAVTAASLARRGDGTHFVPLDACIETMRQTGIDMNAKYKETSLGGLAVNVVQC